MTDDPSYDDVQIHDIRVEQDSIDVGPEHTYRYVPGLKRIAVIAKDDGAHFNQRARLVVDVVCVASDGDHSTWESIAAPMMVPVEEHDDD